ncbi:hypothetical protein ACG904_18595, partial [Acinetobacter guillouiae]
GCAVDFVCRLLHLKIISLKNPLQIGLCNKALSNSHEPIAAIARKLGVGYSTLDKWIREVSVR